MARSGNIDIRSVFEGYLQKERQFEQEIEECNKLRREIRSRNVVRVSDASSTSLLVNLEKSRVRNQTLLKVCYNILLYFFFFLTSQKKTFFRSSVQFPWNFGNRKLYVLEIIIVLEIIRDLSVSKRSI
ncbi:PREDICTED: uncharacterized protein LOC106744782 isoform X1 [Dinoponera quadriceps]|uniref:Uncharacterized protein LOC106744782 isoform X1 n=1 Tax=Dinoponera quadriceps TaxID=609295 RepID=A0A6P3XBM5_DINQU|nr:PREDICTED: uncharacterized protein LOC106744782 isoform X1 [Dinoponera quadriceps]